MSELLSTRIRNDPQNHQLMKSLASFGKWEGKSQRHHLNWISEDLSESDIRELINQQSEYTLKGSIHKMCQNKASFELISLYKNCPGWELDYGIIHSLKLTQYLLTRGIQGSIDSQFEIVPNSISLGITCGLLYRIDTSSLEVKEKHSWSDVLVRWGIATPGLLRYESGLFGLWVDECGDDTAKEKFQRMYTKCELFTIGLMDCHSKLSEGEETPEVLDLLTENIEYLNQFALLGSRFVDFSLFDVQYAVLCHVVEHNEYGKLRELQNAGLRIDEYTCSTFCRIHPIYDFWKKLASSMNMRVTIICRVDDDDAFRVLPITFWAELINDYGPERVLEDIQEFGTPEFLKRYCEGIMNYNKYRKAQKVQGRLLPRVGWEKED